ncbi:MAG: YegS/Rv2252/BmrU family lipid kinase [Clostridia bacterium]|nr:YegS/Rv2252/BmrU family lipid kinase [Clostridia bacterium]
MKTLLFIYNPRAGKSKIRSYLADIIEIFDRAGYQITVRPTRRKGDVVRWINRHAQDFDRIIVSGGDGTLNEALSGVRIAEEKGKRTPDLGYIPTGSTNDFAISLGIPTDPLRAAQVAATGEIFPCDCGTFNGTPFAYVAAFGAFTKVSYATPQQTKNSLGHFAYVLEGIKALPQIKGIPFTVQTDEDTFSGSYLYGMVSNSNSIGGFNGFYGKEPVALDDGLLEVLLIKEPRTLAEQSELMSDLLRTNLRSRHMVSLKTKKISFISDVNVPWTLDGEFGGNPNAAEILAVKDAFRVAIPPKEVHPALR